MALFSGSEKGPDPWYESEQGLEEEPPVFQLYPLIQVGVGVFDEWALLRLFIDALMQSYQLRLVSTPAQTPLMRRFFLHMRSFVCMQ